MAAGRVIIANALDDASANVRRAGAKRELAALVGLGVDAVERDLREYFGQEPRLRRDLAWVSLAWLRDGNVFMLRYALRRGGPVDVWAVAGKKESELVTGGSGFCYFPAPISPAQVTRSGHTAGCSIST